MPRCQREQSASSMYHVMVRGNERKEIFLDDEDKVRFLDTLKRMKGKDNYYLYAYCLMDNHVHLLITEGKDTLARIMKRIGVSYVYYFNKKYCRTGHLFQDRFKSESIDSDSYLLAAARYIHNNPVKAGVVKNPGDYTWSSYNSYANESIVDDLIEKEQLLGMFSTNKGASAKRFIDYTQKYNDDAFMECEGESKRMLSNSEIKAIINVIVKNPEGVEHLRNYTDKAQRKMILREIKEKTGAPVRELSRILGISKDIIFRA